jgi:hypothetical protein
MDIGTLQTVVSLDTVDARIGDRPAARELS